MSKIIHDGYLIHYNHNHDALGRFAKSSGGGSKTEKARAKLNKKFTNNDRDFVREYANAYATEKSKLRNIRRSEEDITELALGRGSLSEGYYVSDPLDPKTEIPQAWSYKTSSDLRKEQKKRRSKR